MQYIGPMESHVLDKITRKYTRVLTCVKNQVVTHFFHLGSHFVSQQLLD